MTGYVYAIGSGDAVKVGWAKDPARRLAELNVGSPTKHVLIGFVPGTKLDEAGIHRKFVHFRIRGEWFMNAGIVAEFVASIEAGELTFAYQAGRSDRQTMLDAVAKSLRERAKSKTDLQIRLEEKGLKLIDLARALGVNKATVTRWSQRRVPAENVLTIERITGISRHELRPDIYPAAEPQPAAAPAPLHPTQKGATA